MRELFLASIGGARYGIWKDEIQAVRGIDALHRIPLSPARIAGVLMEDGRTVTLADLAACLGYEPRPGNEQATAQAAGSILLMEQRGSLAGLVVYGEPATLPIPDYLIFPLPDFLKSPVFDACAVHDNIPIPVIDVAALYARAMHPGEKSAAAPRVLAALSHELPPGAGIRIFFAGGELFAACAAGIAVKPAEPAAVTPLPDMPPYVSGVAFLDGRLLPVIDLPQRIKGQGAAPDAAMLIADIGGDAYALLVDRDGGTLPGDQLAIRAVPAIIRTPWLHQVAVRADELIPLVDVAQALSDAALSGGAAEQPPLWQRYAPDSRFSGQFFRHDVEVVEFSLLGERHALPKQEVVEVIALRPWRELPDLPPIVVGVAGHDGEVLPVLDLAMMFGRRSLATPAWRMMLVSNGDFRALVVTEAVFRERRLPLASHRAVPLKLPHPLMYGCYPDAEAVRLILNIEAIAVHFKKSLVKQFLPALSPRMRMMSAAALPGAQPGEVPVAVREPAPRQVPQQPQAVAAAVETTEVQQELAGEAVIEAEPEPAAVERAAASSADTARPLSSADAWGGWDEDEILEQESDSCAGKLPEAVPEKSQAAGTLMVEVLTAEPAVDELLPDAEYAVAERQDTAAASAQISPGFRYPAEVEDAVPVSSEEFEAEADTIAPEPERASRSGPSPAGVQTFPDRQAGAAAPGADRTQMHAAPSRDSADAERMPVEVRKAGRWQRGSAYGAIAALLIAATFYFTGAFDGPDAGKTAQGMRAVQMQQAPAQADRPGTATAGTAIERVAPGNQPGAKPGMKPAAQPEIPARTEPQAKPGAPQSLVLTPLNNESIAPPPAAEKSAAPLELNVPASRPVDIEVYVVQDGDTLWSISARFTDSPYNYPRIAGENRIADPDMIFPGQRIRLIK